jgi:hypothetical protein
LAWAVWLAAGCGLQQPAPTLREIAPAAVCGGGAVTLTLSGDGFVALPTDVLGAHSVALPHVIIDGPMRLDLGDDAAGASGPVTYVSSQSLTVTFDIPPAGQYSVFLVNPDGKSSALAGAFTSTTSTPITIDRVDPPALCSSGAPQTVILTGSGFLAGSTASVLDNGGTLVVTGAPTTVNGCTLGRCSQLVFAVPKDVLAIGSYTVEVDAPAGGGCEGSARVAVAQIDGPHLTATAPDRVCSNKPSSLKITGDNFKSGATVQLIDTASGMRLDATVTVDSATQITASFPAVPAGFTTSPTVDVVVTNPDLCSATVQGSVKVGGC